MQISRGEDLHEKKIAVHWREDQLKSLENLVRKKSSSLAVVYGRRRIGKSRLIEEFAKKYKFVRFSGSPPTLKTSAQDQRNEFSKQMSRSFGLPNRQMEDWGDLLISLPRGFSCWPVLIHVNGVTYVLIESSYFTQIIDFSTLLH